MSERCVIIVAGGKGLRMGGDLPKQFIPMAGKPVLMHTLEAFHRWDPKARLVLVLPKSQQDYWAMLVREIGCRAPHEVADGGETRFHSVLNGLRRLSDTISGHDGQVLVGVQDLVNRKEWADRLCAWGCPPVLLLSGEEDPVGAYGKGVRKVYNRLRQAGAQDVQLKLYPGARHEMLNEINREQVYQDILAWCEERL